MEQLFYAVAVLACPVGMGLMMFFMMRRPSQAPAPSPGGQDELTRLRAEIDQLKAAQRDRSGTESELS
jgi:hypothetical protein